MANFLQSSRDKATAARTLLCLVQALVDKETTVELRNETEITGTISLVDGRMNIEMTDVTVTVPNGESRSFSLFYIRARNVRYVHIPPSVNIMSTLEARLNKPKLVAKQETVGLSVLITRRKREQLIRLKQTEAFHKK